MAKTVYNFGIDAKVLGVDVLMEKLRGGSFKTRLNEALYKLHGKYHLGDKEQMKLSETLFSPLAVDFFDKKVYIDADEVRKLLEDKEYIPIDFVRPLAIISSDEQLRGLYKTIEGILSTEPKEFYSPFLGNLAYYSKDRNPLADFLTELRNNEREQLYISLMAGTENADLGHFHQLLS